MPADRLIVGDLNECHGSITSCSNARIEAVVHFAAFTYVGESVREPAKYYQNNLVNTLDLMECLRRKNGISRFVFSSTAATYGVPETMPITEETPQQPINPYGNTKLAIEHALADYAEAYGWGYAALRYFNAAGASPDGAIGEDHDPETHLIPLVLRRRSGDAAAHRDLRHRLPDARRHLHPRLHPRRRPGRGPSAGPGTAASRARACVYNLGIGRGYSVREVIRPVEEVTGKKVPVKEGPRRPGDPPVLVASSAKITRELGWKPHYADLRRAILDTAWQWHKTHPPARLRQPAEDGHAQGVMQRRRN